MKLTSNQSYYLAAAVVILATAAGIVVAYPKLPQTVPIHWDIHGQVNGWASKSSLFLYGPVLMAADRRSVCCPAMAFSEEVRGRFVPHDLPLHHDRERRPDGIHSNPDPGLGSWRRLSTSAVPSRVVSA